MMAQTDDGFLWLAMGSGLMRFDGTQFERYAPAAGETLPSASIRSLLALPGNALWIGWVFGGVTLLRDGHATRYGEAEGYPPGTTYQFLSDSGGVVWAATTSGLARFDGRRWQRIGADWNFAGERALSLFQDRDGTMSVFTDSTLMVLPRGAMSFRAIGGSSATRMPIAQAPDGALYISDLHGIRAIPSLAEYEMGRPLIVHPPNQRADSGMRVDRNGGIWFSAPAGIGRIANPKAQDAQAEYFTKADGLTDDTINALFEDRQGSIWVATANGLDQFRVGSFVPPLQPLKAQYPALLPSSDGGLLFAALDFDLNLLSADGTVRQVETIFATCAYRDPTGAEWYGSQPRAPAVAELVRRKDGRTQHVALSPDVPPEVDIQAITMDGNGSLWVSVIRRGVYKLANNKWTRPAELPDSGKLAALTLTTDSQGRIWLGYPANRVARWDGRAFHVFTDDEGLDVGNVLAIHEKGPHIWVGGEHGLALFDAERFRPMRTVDPTVLRGITGIIETSKGDLWLHGIAGAIMIKAAEIRRAASEPSYPMNFRLFDDDDSLYGVPTDIRPLPTLVEGTDGTLWFGTNRGVFAVAPGRLVTNDSPPTVVLKQFRSGNSRFELGSDLRLPPLTSSVQFDYTATSLAIAQRARFRYRLDGVDRDWQDAGSRRQAFYMELGPGRYRFQVVASNENGVWNQTGATTEFTILPGWYQMPWFRELCVAAGIALLWLLYRLRLAQLRRQMYWRLQERLLERERIARELHDTLIQGFQGLVLLFESAMQRLPSGHPAHERMSKALARADEVLAEGRDRVRGLRNSIRFDQDLPSALQEAADDLSHISPAAFAMSVNGTQRPLHPVVIEEMYQIGREALHNAYRHAEAKHVQLEVTFGSSQLRLRIHDDGKGIDKEVLRQGGIAGHWGIPGMRERAQKLRAELSVRSESGFGTEVDLRVPSAVAYRKRVALPTWWRFLLGRQGAVDHE